MDLRSPHMLWTGVECFDPLSGGIWRGSLGADNDQAAVSERRVQAPVVVLLDEAGQMLRDILAGLESHRVDSLDLQVFIRLSAIALS
jgi:hypothetical protein